MAFCTNCGCELAAGATFCGNCGTSATALSADLSKEQQFLDTTHKFMRWEKKAWSICGTVYTVLGIIFAAFFSLFSIIFLSLGDDALALFGGIFFVYALIFGGMFIAVGIVNKINAKKLAGYLEQMHTNLQPTLDRCSSIGMIVLCVFFNEIALIFYIINFVRMKSSKQLIEQILSRQKGLN